MKCLNYNHLLQKLEKTKLELFTQVEVKKKLHLLRGSGTCITLSSTLLAQRIKGYTYKRRFGHSKPL